MFRSLLVAMSLSLIFSSALAKSLNFGSSVTIPLQDYLELVKQNQPEQSFVSIEEAKITGEYGRELKLTVSGRSANKPTQVKFMAFSNQYRISNCSGNAAIALQEDHFGLLPSAKTFRATCDVTVLQWQQPVVFQFKNVIAPQVLIKGAEATLDQGASDVAQYVVRPKDRTPAAVVGAEPTVKAFHRMILSKDENRFEYRFDVLNPNGKVVDFLFETTNGEIVTTINTLAKYTENKGAYRFTLVPGASQILVSGRLPNDEWKPVYKTGIGYVLVDQHPLISTKIESKARQISPAETGLMAVYPAPKAFLLSDAESFKWTKTELGAFAADSYTVDSANYRYFWSPKGTSIVESELSIQNQSATEIALAVPGVPTYLEIDGQTVGLTKDENDNLIIKLAPNRQQHVLIQYKIEKNPSRGLASISGDLIKPEATVSTYAVNLIVPTDHTPLWYKTGTKSYFWTNWTAAFRALFLFLVLFLTLRHLQVQGFSIYGLSIMGCLLTFFYEPVFSFVLFVVILMGLYGYRHRISDFTAERTWKDYLRYSLLAILLFGSVSYFKLLSPNSQNYSHNVSYPSAPSNYYSQGMGGAVTTADSGEYRKSARGYYNKKKAMMPSTSQVMVEEQAQRLEMESDTSAAPSKMADGNLYQGLPSRIQIPGSGRSLTLVDDLSMAKESLSFSALTIPRWLFNTLGLMIGAFWLLGFYRQRQLFLNFVR